MRTFARTRRPVCEKGTPEIIFFAMSFAVKFRHEKTQTNCRKRSMTNALLSCYTNRTGFGLSGAVEHGNRSRPEAGTRKWSRSNRL